MDSNLGDLGLFKTYIAFSLFSAALVFSCKTPSPRATDSEILSEGQNAVPDFVLPPDLPPFFVGAGSDLVVKLIKFLEGEITALKTTNTFTNEKVRGFRGFEADDTKPLIELLAYAITWCKSAKDSMNQQDCYYNGLHSYYSAVAAVFEKSRSKVGADENAGLGRFLEQRFKERAFNFTVAFTKGYVIDGRDPNHRLTDTGEIRAEADNLYEEGPFGPGFFGLNTLRGKSIRQVSRLEIGPNHPIWYREDQAAVFKRTHDGNWRSIEQKVEQSISRFLSEERTSGKEFGNARSMAATFKPAAQPIQYSISNAKKVLFFDKMKTTATSPKIDTEDALGIDWKLKWGDEIQTEPVGNRLWTYLGGKWNDLVYANGPGKNGVTLILGKKNADPACKAKTGSDRDICLNDEEECKGITEPTKKLQCVCKEPKTVSMLQNCMLNVSVYKFNISPYVIKSGEIDDKNAATILPDSFFAMRRKKYHSLAGRDFLQFNESIVELSLPDEVSSRIGPAPKSLLNATKDRVARGLYLFNLWIGNRDSKDDNDRLIYNHAIGGEGFKPAMVHEFQHDLGFAFGGVVDAGRLNWMFTGENFLRKTTANLLTGNFVFKYQPFLYRPEPWQNATFADILWMADKIVAVPDNVIREIVGQTNWPKFMKDVFAYKLIARRNQIARLFTDKDVADQPPKVVVQVPRTEADAKKVLATLVTNFKDVEDSGLANLIAKDVVAEGAKSGRTTDVLVNESGIISTCDATVWMGILERHLHPSGIENRISRRADHLPKEGRVCAFNKPPSQSAEQDFRREVHPDVAKGYDCVGAVAAGKNCSGF